MSGTYLDIQPEPVADTKAEVAHVPEAIGEAKEYVNRAARGTENEHDLTLRQAIRKYPAAIGWTVVVCCAW